MIRYVRSGPAGGPARLMISSSNSLPRNLRSRERTPGEDGAIIITNQAPNGRTVTMPAAADLPENDGGKND